MSPAGEPIVETWVDRLVGVIGVLHGRTRVVAQTYDVVHVQVFDGLYRARVVSRRTECDGRVVDWRPHPPRSTALSAAEWASLAATAVDERYLAPRGEVIRG